jgi:hypothetical protein
MRNGVIWTDVATSGSPSYSLPRAHAENRLSERGDADQGRAHADHRRPVAIALSAIFGAGSIVAEVVADTRLQR